MFLFEDTWKSSHHDFLNNKLSGGVNLDLPIGLMDDIHDWATRVSSWLEYYFILIFISWNNMSMVRKFCSILLVDPLIRWQFGSIAEAIYCLTLAIVFYLFTPYHFHTFLFCLIFLDFPNGSHEERKKKWLCVVLRPIMTFDKKQGLRSNKKCSFFQNWFFSINSYIG